MGDRASVSGTVVPDLPSPSAPLRLIRAPAPGTSCSGASHGLLIEVSAPGREGPIGGGDRADTAGPPPSEAAGALSRVPSPGPGSTEDWAQGSGLRVRNGKCETFSKLAWL